MRKLIVLMFVLSFGLFLPCQTASSPGVSATQSELPSFKVFIEQHPHALADLKKDPSLVGTQQFAKIHRGVGEYIAAHPKLIEELKRNPKFFQELSATSGGGGDGGGGGGRRGWQF